MADEEEKEREVCSKCDGRGMVYDADDEAKGGEGIVDCPNCGGDGWIEK